MAHESEGETGVQHAEQQEGEGGATTADGFDTFDMAADDGPSPDAEARTPAAETSEGATEAEPGQAVDAHGGAVGEDDPVPVGIKIGSTRTVATLPDGEGGVRTVRSLTCVATYNDPLTGEERLLFGDAAAREYPDRSEFMLRSGLPEDADRAELAGKFFEWFVGEHDLPEDSVVAYAVPTIENEQGLETLERVVEEADVGGAGLADVPESLCGAIPATGEGLDALDRIFVAVNLGSTNLEAVAYRRGEQFLHHATGAITGNEVDRDIAANVEAETQGRVKIDPTTAREYKEHHADFGDYQPFTAVVQQPGGGAHEFTIETSVTEAVDAYLDAVVDDVANEFLSELANDSLKVYELALDQPIVLTGGMATIPGLVEEFERRLSSALQRDVTAVTSSRPDLAAADGAHLIARELIQRT